MKITGKKIVAFLMALLLCVSGITLDAFVSEAATIRYSGTDGDLTWTIDSDGHLLVEGSGDYTGEYPGWYSRRGQIHSAEIAVNNVTNLSRYFYNCFNLESIEWVELDTSRVTDMSKMFYACWSLSSLDLSNFNTSNVTNMSGMFSGCYSLSGLYLYQFNTSKVTDMSGMFEACFKLTNLDLSGLDTSNVINMSRMFQGCSGLTSLNLKSLDTSKVTNMSGMFEDCENLMSLDLSGLDTSKVTDISGMFRGCNGLTSLDLSGLDTSKVTDMASLFEECSNLTNLNLNGLQTANVTNMSAMFWDCDSLTNLDLTNFDTSKVTAMAFMFRNCSSLTSLDLSNFNTSNVTNMMGMFAECREINDLNISCFDTSQVTNMEEMFRFCSGLTSLNVSGFDTSKVQCTAMMFEWCSGLKQLDLSSWDMAQVSDELWANSMFENCNQLIKLSTPINVNIDVNLPTNEVGNWTSHDGQIHTILPKNTNVSMTLSCGEEKSETLTGYTISLKGDIAVNLHMQLSDEILNDTSAYMEFTYADGEILHIPVDKAETKSDSYVFTCNVQAPEVNDKFTAQIITSVCETEKYTYSVKEYADYILAHTEGNEEYTKAAPMVRAMLNYGGYSQLQFKHNTDALANDGLYTTEEDPVLTKDVTIDDSYTFTAPNEDIGLRYYGSSLLLDAETTIRHYFTITSEEDIAEICEKYSFVLDDVTVLTPSMRGGMIYIDIKGINAAELDDMFNLVVKNTATEATISVTYSPFSYAKYVLENAIAGTNLVNVIKAMCLYNEAANNYFE